MNEPSPELIARFATAVADLDRLIPSAASRLVDDNAVRELRVWLDGNDTPLEWTLPYPDVTADEWFFVSTLYGQMTLDGQRTHIRRFFPTLFVRAAQRDIRTFCDDLGGFDGLRANWMKPRLCKMGAVLRERGLTMAGYVEQLRSLESGATPANPMPALDAILRDHRAGEGKTLSVFVRDCVGGNCFPIDSRVRKEVELRGLPVDERKLVSLALAAGRSPRQVARMFYEAGGELGRRDGR